jgi:DNA replication protein DnaC
MLMHPTLDKIEQLRLFGMAKALREQFQNQAATTLSFEERLGLLIDREMSERENKRLATRLRTAKLRVSAAIEDIDYRQPRGLDKSLVLSLASNQWITEHHNLLIVGPTGVGKSYLACALSHKACRDGHVVLYQRLPRLLEELALSHHDGRYRKLMKSLLKADLLILDDFGLAPLTTDQQRDLLEIIDDRYDRRSTLVTSQLPVKHWHDILADPTLADAILDRLVHNAYKIELKGESMRKSKSKINQTSIVDKSKSL